jgi:hypothetical protein
MAFPVEILRLGVGLANHLTTGVQQIITIEPWIGQNAHGPLFGAPVVFDGSPGRPMAIVDTTTKQRVVKGQWINIAGTLTFLGDVSPNGAPGREEPIDTRDRVTLADGTRWPIVSSGGFNDPGTGRPLAPEVWLGAR